VAGPRGPALAFAPASGADSVADSGAATVFHPVGASSPLLQRYYLAQEGEAESAGTGSAGARVEFYDLTAGEDGTSPDTRSRSRDATLARMRSLMLGSRQGTVHDKQMPQPTAWGVEPTDWEDGECADGERMSEWLDSQMQLIPSSTIQACLNHVACPRPAPQRTSRISFDREAVDNSSPSNLADMRYLWLGSRQGSVAGALGG